MATHDGTVFDLLCVPALELHKGETVTYYPYGEDNTAQTGGAAQSLTNVMVDLGEEMSPERSGMGIVEGDGVVLDGRNGIRDRRQGRLEIDVSISVNERFAEWSVRGEVWQTVRIEGRDESKQTIRIVRRGAREQTTVRPRLRAYSR